MMHTHLLHPSNFVQDISTSQIFSNLAGELDFQLEQLIHRLRLLREPISDADAIKWTQKYKYPFQMMEIPHGQNFPPRMKVAFLYHPKVFKLAKRPFPFSFDLREAAKRQMAFSRKITSAFPYDPVPSETLTHCQQRYVKYMNLIRVTGNPGLVPALDIDLFWHTHQLSSSNYLPWCAHHIGHHVDHDDAIGEAGVETALDSTVAAWVTEYSEDYYWPSSGPIPQAPPSQPNALQPAAPNTPQAPPSQPSISQPSALRPAAPSTLDRIPPPGLNYAQLRLWQFDVDCQVKHEAEDFKVLQNRQQLDVCNAEIASLPPLSGGLMKRMLKTVAAELGSYTPGSRPALKKWKLNLTSAIEQDMYWYPAQREAWGRERWPLLVAARGWGDPRVTAGAWVRPPQGTASLDFPIFAATWYDNKDLGYYNYITGGPDGGGGITGGGVRLGGAMCAGRFDGGNCVAARARYTYDNNAGGGG